MWASVRVGDVDDADVGVDEHGQLAVDVVDDQLAVAGRAPRALDRGRVDRDDLHAGAVRGGKRRLLALVLGAVVDREVGAAVDGVLVADRALDLPHRGARRRVDHTLHPRPGRGLYDELGADRVDLQQQLRVRRAVRVEPCAVEDEVAALHPPSQRVLVEHVAADHLEPARGDLLRARVRAREPDEVVAALVQPCGERAADEPAGARDEGAAHSQDCSRCSRTRSMTSERCSSPCGRIGGPKLISTGWRLKPGWNFGQ